MLPDALDKIGGLQRQLLQIRVEVAVEVHFKDQIAVLEVFLARRSADVNHIVHYN